MIFGARRGVFDSERYARVLHACALETDLEIFEAGDMTGAVLLPRSLDCFWA